MTVVSTEFLSGKVVLHQGDAREVLRGITGNSFDACVTDPPYALSFMGKAWDTNALVHQASFWRAVRWSLKPGAHLIAFGGTRTYHRMVCAIEDAGFEIRDTLMWLYGSGFPKSHDVSKGIDRAAGAEREIICRSNRHGGGIVGNGSSYEISPEIPFVTAPATDAARQWQGYGTALKPACEPIVLARKPLSEGNVAANVLRWGCGALNIDGCRIETKPRTTHADGNKRTLQSNPYLGTKNADHRQDEELLELDVVHDGALGRWPANVVHDGSEEVLAGFPETQSGETTPDQNRKLLLSGWGYADRGKNTFPANFGSAARFFYTAKADSDERIGSKHPTVKPLDLMQWLVRLVTPKGGLVLDPFAGTGTTGEASWREGMRAVLIEKEETYCTDIARRMTLVLAGSIERSGAIIKARDKSIDFGPLFDSQIKNGAFPNDQKD